jgi:hypothetical protein
MIQPSLVVSLLKGTMSTPAVLLRVWVEIAMEFSTWNKFPMIGEAKSKQGVFVGLQIRDSALNEF